MAVPPPPPPGPPPPPVIGNFNLGGGSNAGQARNMLLADITKGKKLKKTITVDKSAPIISGKVTSNNTSTSHANLGSQTLNSSSNSISMNGPKLGGIFGDMATMPRLKPVGSRSAGVKQNPHVDNPTQQSNTLSRQPLATNGSTGMDFGSELANKLKSRNKPVTEKNLQLNRGPPPQPPKETDQNIENKNNLPVIGPKKSASASSSPVSMNEKASPQLVIPSSTGMAILPNKSTLFSSTPTTESSQAPSFNINSNIMSNTSVPSQNNVKPIVNHGKPNLAPKPPNMVPPTGNGSRGSVARHQSMRSPRSPPIIGVDGPVFTTSASKFGTVRIKGMSQEQINQPFNMYPSRPIEPPPKPPSMKTPPSMPIKSVSNSNLSNLPLSLSLGTDSSNLKKRNNAAITNAQSETHLATLNQNNSCSPNHQARVDEPPPLPPHRNPPAIPKQLHSLKTVAPPPTQPPPPPTRTTSTMNRQPQINQTSSINRIISDLETKFAGRFHTVNEFPAPPPFQNNHKTYPSHNKQAIKGE
ncbi:uncharacterized protein LOC134836867 isoform X2 [Culicoides brevitarsis]|uniref:uncharacterized protein LOC134836867 isoform X2 n=2 Tax=Culicoides brevitarsis TaxID=469753 RepID=UPI00307CC020